MCRPVWKRGTTNLEMKNNSRINLRIVFFFSVFISRGLNDLYEYNTGESNVDKSVDDIIDVEEKRSHRAGCECQLSVRSSFCDGHMG